MNQNRTAKLSLYIVLFLLFITAVGILIRFGLHSNAPFSDMFFDSFIILWSIAGMLLGLIFSTKFYSRFLEIFCKDFLDCVDKVSEDIEEFGKNFDSITNISLGIGAYVIVLFVVIIAVGLNPFIVLAVSPIVGYLLGYEVTLLYIRHVIIPEYEELQNE